MLGERTIDKHNLDIAVDLDRPGTNAGNNQQSIDLPVCKHLDVPLLNRRRFFGITQDDIVAELASRLIKRFHEFREERIGNVRNYQAEGVALLAAQTSSDPIWPKSQLVYRCLDPLPYVGCDCRIPIDDARHRPKRDTREPGYLPDHHTPRELTSPAGAARRAGRESTSECIAPNISVKPNIDWSIP
jgi:hypothetical protein